MMSRILRPVLAVILLGWTIGAACAAEPGFTPAQRQDIVKIVREALKSDPSILRDAVASLQADNEAREAASLKAQLAEHRQDLLHNPMDQVAGNAAGDVTLVEFYDPRCPYCRRVLPTLEVLLRKDPHLRLVYKDIPVLGPASTLESRAILAARLQGAYLKMQAALMRDTATPTDASIRDTARSLNLDPDRLAADMNGQAVTKQIEANLALAHALKVEGTPVFVVGDQLIPGAVQQSELEAAIAQARG